MTICITAKGKSPESEVDSRFGRCEYFLFFDSTSQQFQAIANRDVAEHGAGVNAAQILISYRTDVVLTGNVGPNAQKALNEAGIKIVIGVNGTAQEALKEYFAGNLS